MVRIPQSTDAVPIEGLRLFGLRIAIPTPWPATGWAPYFSESLRPYRDPHPTRKRSAPPDRWLPGDASRSPATTSCPVCSTSTGVGNRSDRRCRSTVAVRARPCRRRCHGPDHDRQCIVWCPSPSPICSPPTASPHKHQPPCAGDVPRGAPSFTWSSSPPNPAEARSRSGSWGRDVRGYGAASI